MTPPLTGPDAHIVALLEAGRSFDDVCEIGRYRKTWAPSAVHRVVSQYLPERRPARIVVPDPVPPLPDKHRHQRTHKAIEHGKAAGYRAHFREGTEPCDPCRDARNQADLDRKRKRTA